MFAFLYFVQLFIDITYAFFLLYYMLITLMQVIATLLQNTRKKIIYSDSSIIAFKLK